LIRKLIASVLHPSAKKSAAEFSSEFLDAYSRNLIEVKNNDLGFQVFESMIDESIPHPESYVDYECGFASSHIFKLKPHNILDVGSYRQWVLGLLSSYTVTVLDIRESKLTLENQNTIICDAKNIELPDNSFDVVTSLSTVEHFGLGRYGDELDLLADRKGINEMIRVLKPGGHLIFTTTITRNQPSIVFNKHRIYSYEMIRSLAGDLVCQEEKFYNREKERFCSLEEITATPKRWDVYCGCWQKTGASIPEKSSFTSDS
jgi:ubiquinone/menaquinone biosynthesis C-methylase UbiE